MNDANRPIVAEYGNAGVLLNLNRYSGPREGTRIAIMAVFVPLSQKW